MKKLYISVTVFILFIFASTTATYAWLSMATSNVIKDIQLSTYLGDSLEISVDGINFYESLPSDEILKLLKNTSLTDITSNDGINFTYGIRNKEGSPEKNKQYISIDFTFRTASINYHEVYLANNLKDINYEDDLVGTYITSKGRYWMSNVDFLYAEDEMRLKGSMNKYFLKDAMRISFSTSEQTKIFDLSENEDRGFGKAYGQFAYHNIVKHKINLPDIVPNTIYKLSDFDEKSPYALDNNSHILTLKETTHTNEKGMIYYEGKVTMNIWVEGWDADLFDAVHGDTIKMQFQFKSVIGIKS